MPTKSELIEFSNRLNYALDLIDFPCKGKGRQGALGKLCGVSAKGARRWLEAEAYPDTGRIADISEKLHISVEWLMTGRGKVQSSDILARFPKIANTEFEWKEIPLISWYQIYQFISDPLPFLAKQQQWLQAMIPKEQSFFGLTILDQSISAFANSKSFLIISPTIKPIHQCKVIAEWAGSDKPSCYIYLEDFPHYFLKPLGKDYPPVQIDMVNRPVKIYGVVSQIYTVEVF